jgi:metallopeptidase family M12-like protein
LYVLRILLAGSCLPLAAQALPQGQARAASTPHFARLADSGVHGVVTLGFDAADYASLAEQHASGRAFTLSRMPVPGHATIDLELRPVCALEEGARAQVVEVDGSVTLLTPRVQCFSGHLADGGAAFLALTEQEMNGYFYAKGELYFVSTGNGTPGRATVAHASQLGELELGPCGVEERFLALLPDGPGGPDLRITTPTLRTADVFMEADHMFRARFASDQECVDYVTLLVTAASEIYRRDIGTRLRIPDRYLRVWNKVPPWGVITGFGSLKNVFNWWQSTANPLSSIPRAAVHVLSYPVFGGTSRGVDGLCSTVQGYEISGASGSFPYPRLHTSRYNWDLFVVCHELGHTFGSPHSSLYSPPIVCTDGSGPDSGTIMSYCHTTYGMAKVGMRFHLREQQKIRGAINTACLTSKVLMQGDYDGDDDVDTSDLSALREVLAQGFRSTAAEEVFDLDGSGSLTDADHDLVATIVYQAPPARIELRNGSGLNPSCLVADGNPVLGTIWHARIQAAGVGSSTLLVGYDEPLDGLSTARGELLVKTTPYGGTKLFSTTAFSDGTWAVHDVPLPLDTALFGRAVSFQALIVDGPSGDQYCNALDVVLSPYE